MSAGVPVRRGGETVVGPLAVFVAAAGMIRPVIDVPVEFCGNDLLAYGGVRGTATAVTTAVIGAAPVEIGFGKGASLELDVTEPASGTGVWTAWLATDHELAAVPAGWAKANSTLTAHSRSLVVYTKAANAQDSGPVTVAITLGGTQVWYPLGTQDACSIAETGITVSHDQSLNETRCVGSSGLSKVTRETEDFMLSFELQDLTVETYARIMDDAAIVHSATGARGPGWREFGLFRGLEMHEYAIVARGYGLSSYVQGGNVQYWHKYVVQSGTPAPVFLKSQASALAVEFRALEDRDAGVPESERYGSFRQQDTLRAA